MSTSGIPDESSQMESMKNSQKNSKNDNLLNKMAQNAISGHPESNTIHKRQIRFSKSNPDFLKKWLIHKWLKLENARKEN